MKRNNVLEECLLEWKKISGMDFCLLDEENTPAASTQDLPLPPAKEIHDFRESPDLVLHSSSGFLYKVLEADRLLYLLLVFGGDESASMIGSLAVCQVRSLCRAYSSKTDKHQFFRSLALGEYSPQEALTLAKKLHIAPDASRLLFLAETGDSQDQTVAATLQSLFGGGCHISPLNGTTLLVLREIPARTEAEDPARTASMMVDMLNTEAMTWARVSYGKPCSDLLSLPEACREARTALAIGRIFYADRHVIGYDRLGIGGLIYQLPKDICRMFLHEVFPLESLDTLDPESLVTIRTFFENNLNMAETARQLYVHRNTLIYRFEKLQKKYGLDVRSFEDALTFQIAMMVNDYLKSKEEIQQKSEA